MLVAARPYSFVTMATEAAAKAAMEELNGQEVRGRRLTVQQFELYSGFNCVAVYLIFFILPS